MLGALLVWILSQDHFAATSDSAKLACFSDTGPAIEIILPNLIEVKLSEAFIAYFCYFYLSGPI
jgi:glycerol uptake facilitator-like aquaporin